VRAPPCPPLPNSGPHTCRVPTPTSEAVEFKERMFEDGMLEALGNCLRGCDYEEDRCNAAGAMLNFAGHLFEAGASYHRPPVPGVHAASHPGAAFFTYALLTS